MTFNGLMLGNRFGKSYLALVVEAYLISLLVLLLLLFLWGENSNVGSFDMGVSNLVTSVVAAPLIETIIFYLIIPYVLYAFDVKKLTINIICASAFSFSHNPDVSVFYLFYFIFGWYLSVCSSRFVFSGGNMLSGTMLVFVMHAMWNLFITSASFVIG